MWRVGSLTMMRRDGLSCCDKEARMFILSDVVVTFLSCRSKMAGYADKEFVHYCLLNTYTNFEGGDGRQGLLGGLANSSKVRSLMGS